MPPIAQDNVAVVSFVKSHSPGDVFSIKGSPHQVYYNASDASGNSGSCSFRVRVTFAKALATIGTASVDIGVISPVLVFDDTLGGGVASWIFIDGKNGTVPGFQENLGKSNNILFHLNVSNAERQRFE